MNYEQLMELPWEEFLNEALSGGPKTTWYASCDWLKTRYTPEQIAHMYIKLYKQLVIYTPDNQPENPQADSLRDYMDIFCYATEQDLIKQLLQDI